MRIKNILIVLIVFIIPLTALTANKSTTIKTKSSSIKKSNSKQNINTNELHQPIIINNNTLAPVGNSPMTGEQINWQVISSGATNASSASYHQLGTLGQSAVGQTASANYSIHQGFWQALIVTDTSCCGQYTNSQTGNTNCDVGGLRDLADITRLIDNVYISKIALCCEYNGNVNGDAGGLINLADITKLIDHVYISKTETALCQ